MTKQALRASLLQKRATLPEKERALRDEALIRQALASPLFSRHKIWLLFAPTRQEPNLLPLAEEGLKRGIRIAFPLCHKEDHTMTFHFVSDLSELMEGSYGIPEPPVHAPRYSGEEALCVVPALSYDRLGHRIGYGGGYYDRFLSTFSGESCGFVYEEFLATALPRESHDVAVSHIITEKEVIRVHAERKEPNHALCVP